MTEDLTQIAYELEGAVATITLDRPAALNASPRRWGAS